MQNSYIWKGKIHSLLLLGAFLIFFLPSESYALTPKSPVDHSRRISLGTTLSNRLAFRAQTNISWDRATLDQQKAFLTQAAQVRSVGEKARGNAFSLGAGTRASFDSRGLPGNRSVGQIRSLRKRLGFRHGGALNNKSSNRAAAKIQGKSRRGRVSLPSTKIKRRNRAVEAIRQHRRRGNSLRKSFNKLRRPRNRAIASLRARRTGTSIRSSSFSLGNRRNRAIDSLRRRSRARFNNGRSLFASRRFRQHRR